MGFVCVWIFIPSVRKRDYGISYLRKFEGQILSRNISGIFLGFSWRRRIGSRAYPYVFTTMAAIATFADFIRSGGTLFPQSRSSVDESNPETVLSKTERLREIWQKTAKVRIGVGIALMA